MDEGLTTAQKFRAVLGEDHSRSLVANIDTLIDRCADLQSERDELRRRADCAEHENNALLALNSDMHRQLDAAKKETRMAHAETDDARAWSRLWKQAAKGHRDQELFFEGRLNAANDSRKRLLDVCGERLGRALHAEAQLDAAMVRIKELESDVAKLLMQAGKIEMLNGAIHEELEEVKADNARLLEAIGAPPESDYSAPEYVFGDGDPLHITDV